MGFKTEITKIHYDKNAKGAFFALLKFASLFYALASASKNFLYDKNIIKPKKVDAFVISVGNLTTGGVGKTPVVAKIAKHYLSKGEKVAIVSRGYGGKLSNKNVNVISDGTQIFYDANMAGDEAFWMANEASQAVVLTSKNRYKACKYAVDNYGATKILLDDGFQHRKLFRDLDIVLIDSDKAFGNENLLPAGPLREGLEAIARIDKLVVVSKNLDHSRALKYAKIMGKKLKKPAFVCFSEPDFSYEILNHDNKLDSETKVVAFSAIGQPQQFYNFLQNVSFTVDFDDHHNYLQSDADKLVEIANKYGVKALVTTEKDAAKLIKLDFSGVKVFALKLKTQLDVESLLND